MQVRMLTATLVALVSLCAVLAMQWVAARRVFAGEEAIEALLVG